MGKQQSGRDDDDKAAGRAARPQESGAARPAKTKAPPKRLSAKRKLEAVQRIIAGESLEDVSRDMGVTVAQLSTWRDRALDSAENGLKSQPGDSRDREIARLQSKVGETTMENELLQDKIERLEGKNPLVRRRSRS